MTWRATASGHFHEVAAALRAATIQDETAIKAGHFQLAKDAALTIVDAKRNPRVFFSVDLRGHSNSADDFDVQVKVSCSSDPEPQGSGHGVETIRGDQA